MCSDEKDASGARRASRDRRRIPASDALRAGLGPAGLATRAGLAPRDTPKRVRNEDSVVSRRTPTEKLPAGSASQRSSSADASSTRELRNEPRTLSFDESWGVADMLAMRVVCVFQAGRSAERGLASSSDARPCVGCRYEGVRDRRERDRDRSRAFRAGSGDVAAMGGAVITGGIGGVAAGDAVG